jgi:2-oxoglutarate dehydrogenase E1 component
MTTEYSQAGLVKNPQIENKTSPNGLDSSLSGNGHGANGAVDSFAASGVNGDTGAVTTTSPSEVDLSLLSQRFGTESLAYLEEVYEQYLRDPSSTPDEWKRVFQSLQLPTDLQFTRDVTGQHLQTVFRPPLSSSSPAKSQKSLDTKGEQEKLDQLVRNYRVRGHILAKIDPLETTRGDPPELNPDFYGFSAADQNRKFSTTFLGGPDSRTLREIVQWLKAIYCGSIGVQFMHIDSMRVRDWLQNRIEPTANKIKLSREHQIRLLGKLCDGVLFEEFVLKKFLGQKSFSLQGAESLIPLLDMAIERASDDGVEEIVFGMAHRGRLNVLANILHKHPRYIFREFLDKDPKKFLGKGDVKYHLGYSSEWKSEKGRNVHLSLCFNPSHLEFIDGVALGRMRAKMDRLKDFDHEKGLVILIHGDAAFAGQGIIQETLNMSELPGYSTGGTIHIIVNNQIGFTTSPEEARSCTYATDVAKMLQIPIFHVNGEDAEAVAQVVKLSMEFRKTFQRDVVIDMYCYRRHGHNESDEPEFTQPVMYRNIKKRPNTFESYRDQLLALRGITREEANEMYEQRRLVLEKEFEVANDDKQFSNTQLTNEALNLLWKDYRGGRVIDADIVDTTMPKAELTRLMLKLCTVPDTFHPHPKIHRIWEQRREMGEGKRAFDWGAAENLAFASLVHEKHPIRFSGQDVARGTFSQRHVTIYDYENGQPFTSLREIANEAGPVPPLVEIYNSPLSEAGVLGFEYGYSLDCPAGLVIWEAQFGDFVNGAQVIIDQFITSAEDKWRRLSSLVMMLPHGFEGQGPEHSSARLERFLMCAAEDNIQIVVPSTPAQHYHCLRRQVLRKWKKPLVMMTPKSLLREKLAVSTLDELASGKFHELLDDNRFEKDEHAANVKLVLICSGKIYYELLQKRDELKQNEVAILRLEQLYPLPFGEIQRIIGRYPEKTPVRWVQEEPKNMGASRYLRVQLGEMLFNRNPLSYVQRNESASPATGSGNSHRLEQAIILNDAFRMS